MVRLLKVLLCIWSLFFLNPNLLLCQNGPYVEGLWDKAFGDPSQGGHGLSSNPSAIAVHPLTGDVYVAGNYRNAGSISVNFIAMWDGAQWHALGGGLNALVNDLVISPDGMVYVGGRFSEAEQPDGEIISVSHVAQWDGEQWSPLGHGVDGRVTALAVDENTGDIFVGGDANKGFNNGINTDSSRVFSPKVLRWNGSQWSPLGLGADAGFGHGIGSIAVHPVSGHAYLAGTGNFNRVFNSDSTRVDISGVAVWNGTEWSNLGDRRPEVISFESNGNLYAGGNIPVMEGVRVNGVALWDGGDWNSLGNGFTDGIVSSIAVEGDHVYIGGSFTQAENANGTTVETPLIAHWDSKLRQWSSLGAGAYQRNAARVDDIAIDGANVYIGGRFIETGSMPSRHFGRWVAEAPDYDVAYVTFQVDMRRILRSGLYNPNYRFVIHILEGELAGRFFLYDADKDSIGTVRLPQPVGINTGYVFGLDVNGDGYDVDDDWIYELDQQNGIIRNLSVPSKEPVILPVDTFDDMSITDFDTGYEAQFQRSFSPGPTGLVNFRNTHLSLQFQNLDRSTALNVRHFMKGPSGVKPDGISILASNILWEVQQTPHAAVFNSTVTISYDFISGDIHQPEDLRLLFLESGSTEWEIIPTSVDQNAMTLTASGLTQMTGRWTIGSVSLNNLGELLPDLVVSAISVPTTAFSGRKIEVSWTVSNSGARPTNVPIWYDELFISESATFNRKQAISLGKVENVTYLGYGNSYSNSAEVILPKGLSGIYNLFVLTDTDNMQQELDEENNESDPGSFDVTLSPYPDLQVTSFVIPPNVFSGDSIQIQWTVENMGTGPTETSEWKDFFFLGKNEELDFDFTRNNEQIRINDTEIDWLRHEGVLQPGESYTSSTHIRLPDDAIGDFYLFAYSDLHVSSGRRFFRGNVYEFNQEFNNWMGEPINIVLTPPPDLVVSDIEGPESANSGDRISIAWEVENQGPGATRAEAWTDAIFLSSSAELDMKEAYSLGIKNYAAVNRLKPDEKYIGQKTLSLPDGISGTYYIFVYSDRFSNVFEHSYDGNNVTRSQPITIERSLYPDLIMGDVTVPTEAAAGDRIEVTWVVENRGDTVTEDGWSDYIYVSPSDVWNREEAILLDQVSQSRSIDVNESQSFSHLVRLSPDLQGDYYIFVQINADSTLFEYPDDSNNRNKSGQITLSAYPPPDLLIEHLAIPAAAASGQPAEFGWKIRNAGGGATLSRQWDEVIYLSSTDGPEFDPENALLVERIQRTGELEAGGDYDRTVIANIPDGISGDYYVIVTTENDSLTGDINSANNFVISESTLPVALSPPVDLEIVQFESPGTVNAGEAILIRWTVKNTGEGTPPDGSWFDAIYLTLQNQLDKNALLLGTAEHEGSLTSNSVYEHELIVEIPAYISGRYNLMLRTDSRDDIYEHNGEENNLWVDSLMIVLPPATDLVVKDVIVDEKAVPGELTNVSWTLLNRGDHPAKARIREAVYLLSTTEFDQAAPVVGIVDRNIDLAPGEEIPMSAQVDMAKTYEINNQGNIIAPLPPVVAGDYNIAVRTNLRKTVRESNLENNTGISAQPVKVTVPELESKEPVEVFIGETENKLYRFDIPDGADVVFRLIAETEASGSSAIFLSRGKAPTRSDFDYSAAEPFNHNQQIKLPSAEGGTWYLLIYVESAGVEVPFTITADILDYTIDDIKPNYGGNTGVVTVYVSGAKFREGSTLYLEDSDGFRHAAQGTYVISSTELAARLLLSGEAEGLRNVVVVAPDGEETTLKNGFDVVNGVGAIPYTHVSYPGAVASRQGFSVEVTVGNEGTNNAIDYYLLLGAHAWQLPDIVVVITKISASEKKQLPIRLEMKDHFPQAIAVPEVDDLPMYISLDSDSTNMASIVLPIWIYEIPPGAELTFEIEIIHDLLDGYISHEAYLVPMPETEFTRTGAPEHLDSSVGFQILSDAVNQAYADIAKVTDSEILNDPESGLRDMIFQISRFGLPGHGFMGGIIGGAAGYFIVGAMFVNPASALLATGVTLGAVVGGVIGSMFDARDARDAATQSGKKLINDNLNFNTTNRTTVKRSHDPNDIIGPEGYGEERWVGIQQPLQYTIRYENDPELASAPAQVVTIRQDLDPSADVRSFRLGQFGFGSFTFNPPNNVSYYSERLDVADSLGVMVDITAGIDVNARQAFWIFRSIDPATGDLPYSVLNGFLPPNDTTGIGEGFVNYRISSEKSSKTGDEIHAEARIIFDANHPIDTPPVFNTIDADLPVSTIQSSHHQRENTVRYELQWTVEDIGSGFREVAIYVAEFDGPFKLLKDGIAEQSYIFNGESNINYKFFSIATDNAGNEEPMKNSEDAITSFQDDGEVGDEIPREYSLYQNYPNPFNPTTTISYDLPQASHVKLQIYNVLGQRVTTLVSEHQQAGSYAVIFDATRLGSGTYLLRLQTGEHTFTRKMMLVK